MENTKTIRKTTDIQKDIEKSIADYNQHRNAGKLSASMKDSENLAELEKEFAHSAMVEHYSTALKASDKIHAILRTPQYIVLAHKDSTKTGKKVGDDGVAKEVVTFERTLVQRKRFISLKAFDAFVKKSTGEYASRDYEWVGKVEDAARVLTEITSNAIGFIFDPTSYRVGKDTKSLYKVEDFMPDKIVGTLQGIIDDIIVDEKDGENRYKLTQYDAQFVLKSFTGFGGVGKIKTANKGTMDGIILSVLLHLVTGLEYEVVYPKVKADQNS